MKPARRRYPTAPHFAFVGSAPKTIARSRREPGRVVRTERTVDAVRPELTASAELVRDAVRVELIAIEVAKVLAVGRVNVRRVRLEELRKSTYCACAEVPAARTSTIPTKIVRFIVHPFCDYPIPIPMGAVRNTTRSGSLNRSKGSANESCNGEFSARSCTSQTSPLP